VLTDGSLADARHALPPPWAARSPGSGRPASGTREANGAPEARPPASLLSSDDHHNGPCVCLSPSVSYGVV
jgi:hypothetical protein